MAEGNGNGNGGGKTYFEQQREALVGEIAVVRALFSCSFLRLLFGFLLAILVLRFCPRS